MAKKRVATLVLSVALLLAVTVGGTLAYLTDTASDVNVMTLGNVQIEQTEWQRAEGVSHINEGAETGDLVPFVQGQPRYPAVPKGADAYTAEATDLFYWGDYVYSGTAGNGLWDDNNLSNVMDKMVFVENTGKSDAYFRTIIAFECPEGMTYGDEPYSQGNELMNNVNTTSYNWEKVGYVTIDGVRYWVEVATYKNIFAAGNQSHLSLLQVTNVEEGLTITNCKVYSKNGINLNNTPYLNMSGCEFDTEGYCVRIGVNGSTNNGNFTIADSTLKSANDDGDAVIILRGTMKDATLNYKGTTLTGTPEITGTANIVK